MTREEFKINKAKEMYPAGGQNSLQFRTGFCTGFDYADSHPRKGLVDIEKVVKWILENADKHIWYDETENECGITNDFIDDLRRAMLEEE